MKDLGYVCYIGHCRKGICGTMVEYRRGENYIQAKLRHIKECHPKYYTQHKQFLGW